MLVPEDGSNRHRTLSSPRDFESRASASFTTPAKGWRERINYLVLRFTFFVLHLPFFVLTFSSCARSTPPQSRPCLPARVDRRLKLAGLRKNPASARGSTPGGDVRRRRRSRDSWNADDERSRRDRHRRDHVRQLERACRQRRHPRVREGPDKRCPHRRPDCQRLSVVSEAVQTGGIPR